MSKRTRPAAIRPPAMERILSHPDARRLIEAFGREPLKRAARAELRESAGAGIPQILKRCAGRLAQDFAPEAPRVINATGILIHTNLGRSPLAESAVSAVMAAARGYHAVELDLASGRRGSRGEKSRNALAVLLGVDAALVVNNNAGAVLLALAALARDRDVLVSRGELVAIGGSFKIPEILEASGARLKEVGTTNRTRIEDYERNHSSAVAAVLTVHPSNYEIRGYSDKPQHGEIAEFARSRRIPWIHDLGSGNLIDLEPFGIRGEERARDSIRAGASIVCFSGDKLLGGPQAGIIAGGRRWIDACRVHPLARALRCDKLQLAAFSATLNEWISRGGASLPIFALASEPAEALRRRAEAIVSKIPTRLSAEIVETASLFGGGTTPEKSFPSIGIALRMPELPAGEIARRLRSAAPPVVGRVEDRRVILDLRAVFPEEDDLLASVISGLAD
jgi:L-seryl-tRNA(Ser) seleniumtransferase